MEDRGARAHHLEVVKTARYWTLGGADSAREVWFVLHGYKQLARRFLERFAPIDDGTRLIVAPEALSRFYVGAEQGRHGPASVVGATWMTREDRLHEISDYVGYLDRLAEAVGTAGRPVTILGFSQGVATATRWVTHGAVRPGRLILWGDFIPPDLDMAMAADALRTVDVVLVRGDRDPALSGDLGEEEARRLQAAGIDHRTLSYAGGHEVEGDPLRSLTAP